MNAPLPIVLVPGLSCSARLYDEQIPALWQLGPVTIATHNQDDNIGAIARWILSAAPPSFALVGLSLGGYIAFEVLRQAPLRVVKLALLDTSARPDSAEQTAQRRTLMEMAGNGRFAEISNLIFPRLVHSSHQDDPRLRQIHRAMAAETGADAYVRQQRAIIGRSDSRPHLRAISCPTLVLVGDSDQVTPPECAAEIAGGMPEARLIAVPECGHLSTLEQPDFVTRALVEFLAH